jgi:histidine ammonia-lyase
MSAYAVHILIRTRKLLQWCDVIAALSCDAFDCKTEPFNPLLHNVRPHAGQMQTAKIMLDLLRGSALANQTKKQVQDPYSFRCIPQVHGASKDAIAHVERVVETEINAVTDNPIVFAQEDEILSGGNFHGQPLALNLDYLAIALSELGSISERRTYQLISGQRGLPAFLIKNAGLNSGMMIPQYTAASISSQNKQLCTPASVDSIVSSNGQEDHVSMGANAATKCLKVLENTERILAIELLNAAQALEFRRPTPSSVVLEQILADYRTHVTFNAEDRVLHDDMQASLAFILQYSLPKF